jgi:uncharacterized protein (DUF302 family)
MELGITKKLSTTYDEALTRVPAALKAEGFGVLTEIDVKETLHRKLGVPFRKYRILGACNPALAFEALQKNLGVGVMMPCNVVVYEGDDGEVVVTAVDPLQTVYEGDDGEVVVTAADPLQTAAVQAGPELKAFAEGVRTRLARVISTL